jgi:hypothetical protein
VQVPEITHPLSSKRVLTMEYVTGANVCDKQALAQMGLKPKDVARLVSETFNEMIFIFGDVSASMQKNLTSCARAVLHALQRLPGHLCLALCSVSMTIKGSVLGQFCGCLLGPQNAAVA